MNILRAGIVGLGWWGRTIVTTLAGSEIARITTATDIDPRAAAFAGANGLAFADDFEALLADPAIDAVILCTPHSLHATQIMAAAAAGKHVFCEKPLCLTLADAVASIAACNRAGVTLGLGHERRFEPPMIELRRLITSGALGTPLQIEANFSQDKFLSLPAENWRLSSAEAPAGPMTATAFPCWTSPSACWDPPRAPWPRCASSAARWPTAIPWASCWASGAAPTRCSAPSWQHRSTAGSPSMAARAGRRCGTRPTRKRRKDGRSHSICAPPGGPPGTRCAGRTTRPSSG